jgi:hypothetical protein
MSTLRNALAHDAQLLRSSALMRLGNRGHDGLRLILVEAFGISTRVSAEGTEFATDSLARGAGCVGESLVSDVRNRESIMGGQGDLSEVLGDTRCRR